MSSSGAVPPAVPGAMLIADMPVLATNMALNPAQVAGGSTFEENIRWGGVLSFLTGLSDVGLPEGVSTAVRGTWAQAEPGGGFDWGGNADLATVGITGSWVAYPVTSGLTVTFSYYGRCTLEEPSLILARFHDGQGNWVGSAIERECAALNADTFTLVEASSTVPSGARYAVFRADTSVAMGAATTFDP